MGLESGMGWSLKRYNTNMDTEMELTPQRDLILVLIG